MTLLAFYHANLKQSARVADPAQLEVIGHYQGLLDQIMMDEVQSLSIKNDNQGFLKKVLFAFNSAKTNKIVDESNRGLYIWGSVGRGKTYLMDLFFDHIKLPKSRYHYHHFMQMIHQKLRTIKDQENPLLVIANNIAKTTKVLCLDEFFVVDITDAMLLAKLIDALFKEKVYLVTTSNCKPDLLYKNGLQRERFLPTIQLIQSRMNVVSLDSNTDYRLRHLKTMDVWHVLSEFPSNQRSLFLSDLFVQLNGHPAQNETHILINERQLDVISVGTHSIHCDFNTLCFEARGAIDYISIANTYHNVLIENIPQFNEQLENEARRFITMIDEFYDRGVKISATAACEIQYLYQGKTLCFEFERTMSRLIEMQSMAYLTGQHLLSE